MPGTLNTGTGGSGYVVFQDSVGASLTARRLVSGDLPGGGGGSVTSVAQTVPSWLSVAGSPITASGTLAITAATGQGANLFVATPDGSTGAVSLRAITVGDLPSSVSVVVASADVTGQTAAVATLATYTPATLGTYEIAGYVNIIAISVDVAQFQVTWTDEASNSRTMIFSPNGVTSVNLSAVGFYSFAVQPIRVKASTAITVSVALTTSIGSILLDAGAFIRKSY